MADEDDNLRVELRHDPARGALILTVLAKRALQLTELQGARSHLKSFGLTCPADCEELRFGDRVQSSPAADAEIEAINLAQFRWGCQRSIGAGEELELAIPSSGPTGRPIVLTLAYRIPRLFGLLNHPASIYARLQPD